MRSLSPKLWEKLMVLSQNQSNIRLQELSQDLGLMQEETLFLLKQIFPAGEGLKIVEEQGDVWIRLKPLSHSDLTVLNSSFSSRNHSVDSPINAIMDLLRELDSWDQHISEAHFKMVKVLDQATLAQQLLRITVADQSDYVLHPWKVLHLDGNLVLIGEDTRDHCLMILAVREMTVITLIDSTSKPKASPYEIEEFIKALRAMNEKETRLILKIYDPQCNNLFPDHHFLGKPCMISNPYGDLIWAAYVEPGEDLYEWLMTLGTNVEILDPVTFKDEYLAYCEEKSKKVA